ncbi:MAG: 50S ribosomal protein L11 methyltransferase, partial [Ghiorsea sp.]|nr:50S ribosomal protein L11 methyltransferase [Ghiorsea sp.]
LSIFAIKLGVKKILAIDNNNLAYEVTKNNVILNNINEIEVIHDDVFNQLNLRVDFIFANLYYHLLEELFMKKEFRA